MLTERERTEIDRLWSRKLEQDAHGVPLPDRHRNLEPASAEFICSLAAGIGAKRMLEIGGSSGISTIALAAAARQTGGRLTSIEIEPLRQAEAKRNISKLHLSEAVEFVLGDAASVLPNYEAIEFAFIDCEKEDYIRFFDMLRLAENAVVIADNIISHDLRDYVAMIRSKPGVQSITLPIGKGLEVTRVSSPGERWRP